MCFKCENVRSLGRAILGLKGNITEKMDCIERSMAMLVYGFSGQDGEAEVDKIELKKILTAFSENIWADIEKLISSDLKNTFH